MSPIAWASITLGGAAFGYEVAPRLRKVIDGLIPRDWGDERPLLAYLVSRSTSCVIVDISIAAAALITWHGRFGVALLGFLLLFGLRVSKDYLSSGAAGPQLGTFGVSLAMIVFHACLAGALVMIPLYPG